MTLVQHSDTLVTVVETLLTRLITSLSAFFGGRIQSSKGLPSDNARTLFTGARMVSPICFYAFLP